MDDAEVNVTLPSIAVQVVTTAAHTVQIEPCETGWRYARDVPQEAGVYVFRLHDPRHQHWHEAFWYVGESGNVRHRLDTHRDAAPDPEGKTSPRVNAHVRAYLKECEKRGYAAPNVDVFTHASVLSEGFGFGRPEPNVGLHNGFTRRLTEWALLTAFTTFSERFDGSDAINLPVQPRLTVVPPADEDFELVIAASNSRVEDDEHEPANFALDDLWDEYEAALAEVRKRSGPN